jgi:hypothetical protein
MATSVALDFRPYIGPLDLTANTKAATFADIEADMKEFTNAGSGGYSEFKPGVIKGQMTVDLLQDFAVGVLDDSITSGGSYVFSGVVPATVGTVVEGDIAYVAQGFAIKYAPYIGAVGDAATAQITMPWSGRFARGKVGHPFTARTTSSNTTGIAFTGPTAAQYMVANLHVLAYTGFTSVAVKITSAPLANFASPTDRIAFTTSTAIGAEYKTAVGSSGWATDLYHRVAWTVTGSGSMTFAVTYGVI